MKTNTPSTTITDIMIKLERAQSLAEVLADAAGGGGDVISDDVYNVGLVIADEIKQAHELLERYKGKTKRPRKEAA